MKDVLGGDPPLRAPRPLPAIDGLTALSILIALAILVLTGSVVVRAKHDAWDVACQASENLRLALTRDITRNFSIYDRNLQGLAKTLSEPGIDETKPAIRRQALFSSFVNAQDLGAVVIVDAAGDVVENSISSHPEPVNRGHRDDFLAQRNRPDLGLYIGLPHRSRLQPDDIRLSISRRLAAPDGRFKGIVAASLSLNFFKRLFAQLDVGPSGTITLFRDDGWVLARYPFRDEDFGQDLSQAKTFRRFAAMGTGQFVDRAAIDGVERLYTFGRVPGFPLILTVSRATGDITGPWWQQPVIVLPVLVALLAATVMLSLMFRRELRRRMEAEVQTRKAVDELAWLAKTDVLTGLRNRRAFDAAFAREWRHSLREPDSTIGLLMIDVDHFKAFNDRYGHQAGDITLQSVATCIKNQVGSDDELAARFGGEEFVVLLPGFSRDRAAAVAERIRSAVFALGIDHPGSSCGRVTVSIGVACCRARTDSPPAVLLKAADIALYEAKAEGRNRVQIGTVAGAEVEGPNHAGPALSAGLLSGRS